MLFEKRKSQYQFGEKWPIAIINAACATSMGLLSKQLAPTISTLLVLRRSWGKNNWKVNVPSVKFFLRSTDYGVINVTSDRSG